MPDAVLVSMPPCPDGVTATLSDGMVVRYKDAAPSDPEVCVMSWRGRTHRYLAGFWGSGRFRKGTADERAAIGQALTGPVGTRTSFEDTRADLRGKVTVEHVASPALPVRAGCAARSRSGLSATIFSAVRKCGGRRCTGLTCGPASP